MLIHKAILLRTANGAASAHEQGSFSHLLRDISTGNIFKVSFHEVSFLPNLSHNLLSLSRLKENGHHVDFYTLELTFKSGHKVKIYELNGLYAIKCEQETYTANVNERKRKTAPSGTTTLKGTKVSSTKSTVTFANSDPQLANTIPPSVNIRDDSHGQKNMKGESHKTKTPSANDRLVSHARLGHFGASYIKQLLKQLIRMPKDFADSFGCGIPDCVPCNTAKATRPHFANKSSNTKTVVGDIVHSDLWIFPTKSLFGHTCAVHFTDDASRFTKFFEN